VARQGKDLDDLEAIIKQLVEGKKLPAKNNDHKLQGRWKNHRECHITPDWLLIYHKSKTELVLERTGSHAELYQ